MTGIVTLENCGQDYIVFYVICDVICKVHPSGLAGWKGSKMLSCALGGSLQFDLQWRDFNPVLKQTVIAIQRPEMEFETAEMDPGGAQKLSVIYKEPEWAGGEWLREHMSKEKKLWACPRGGEDKMMYNVVEGEIEFVFSCANKAAIAASDAFRKVDKIPRVLLEDLEGVMLFDTIKPGRPETIADIGHEWLVIYNNNIVDYGIIAHEATHAWAKDKWGTYDPPENTDYMAAIRSDEPPITEYAKTSPAEDLAEAIRYYVINPELMKAQCPRRYEIVEMMMQDPNYDG